MTFMFESKNQVGWFHTASASLLKLSTIVISGLSPAAGQQCCMRQSQQLAMVSDHCVTWRPAGADL